MSRTILIFALIAAGAFVAAGCEPDGGKSAPVGNASALVSDEASAEAVAHEDYSSKTPVDQAHEPFTVAWTDAAETAVSCTLSFEVTNATDEERAVTVALVAESVLGVARKPFGEVTLAAGESAAFSLDAAELPIRSAEVVSQIAVELTRTNVAGLGPFDVTTRTAERWFLHEAGYGAGRAYTQESFLAELGGVYFSLGTNPEALTATALEAKVLGEIADMDGEYSTVTAANSKLVKHDGSGAISGIVLSGTDGREAVGDDSEAIVSDEASFEEMEVGDE
jgi:hypothetical protein